MEQERIKELLDKYFEGISSEAEEAQIAEYLSDPSCRSSLPEESGFVPRLTPEIPEPTDGFLEKLGDLPLHQSEIIPRSKVYRYAAGAAAAAAIMAGAWLIFNYTGRAEMKDTYKDPYIAMAEVRNILLTVSEKMTTGTEPLGSVSAFTKAPETLGELRRLNSVAGDNLSKLRYLEKLSGPDSRNEKQ